jgi:hypothetical protein
MATYPQNQDGGGRLKKCAVCAATVLADINRAVGADANTVCAACGMMVVEPPFEDRDYFDLIMRLGRPKGRGKSRRRIVSEH